MKFRLIADQRETCVMCDVMGVSPAGYYAWRGRPESLRRTANRALLTEIRRVHIAAAMARPGFTQPCAPGGIW
jgi:putative transposase